MTKQKGNSTILLVFIGIILIGAGYFFINNSSVAPVQNSVPGSSPKPPNETTKKFESETMKFSIEIPSNYQIEEKFTTVSLNNSKGEILISRNSTNFENLEEYLKSLSSNNGVAVTGDISLTINNLSAQRGLINKAMTYFIYASNRVYSISTSSESLYSDLDQIAQSFRYIP